MSAAKATGSAWKLPPDSASSVSAKISGLSVTPLASSASVARRLTQEIEASAHHLRLAAQAIGVLHAVVAGEMRRADRAALQQRAQRRGDFDLAGDGGAGRECAESNGVSEPRAPSVDSAPVTSAERNSVSASNRPASALAVENWVPLSSARPSFGLSSIGASPTSASASAAGATRSPTRASPTPIIAAAICASGARSPEAPTEPLHGTIGVNAARKHRFDETERARVDARSALGEAGKLQRHHQPRRRDRRGLADRRRHATARCCAEARRDRQARCAPSPVCRSRY